MKIRTVRQFRDSSSALLRSKEPVLVISRGRLAGVFFPYPEASLPLELKRELFARLSSEIAEQIEGGGMDETDVVAGFESWRKKRKNRHRRYSRF